MNAWPALPLAEWQPTYETLHMWTDRRQDATRARPNAEPLVAGDALSDAPRTDDRRDAVRLAHGGRHLRFSRAHARHSHERRSVAHVRSRI